MAMHVDLGNVGELTKPVGKLVDAVRSGTGMLYQPFHVVRMAKAEARALEIADAAQHAREQRAIQRLTTQESRRQEHIDAVVERATAALPDSVTETPVDPDWTTRFFEDCQDVSDEHLQALWGKVLAAEVTSPGSCSRRTLSVLRDLNRSDAELFERAASLAWSYEGWNYIPVLESINSADYNVSFGDLLSQDCLGLLRTDSNLVLNLEMGSHFSYHGNRHWVIKRGPGKVGGFRVMPFTEAGNQLARACNLIPPQGYYEQCLNGLRFHCAHLVSPWPRNCDLTWQQAMSEEVGLGN